MLLTLLVVTVTPLTLGALKMIWETLSDTGGSPWRTETICQDPLMDARRREQRYEIRATALASCSSIIDQSLYILLLVTVCPFVFASNFKQAGYAYLMFVQLISPQGSIKLALISTCEGCE